MGNLKSLSFKEAPQQTRLPGGGVMVRNSSWRDRGDSRKVAFKRQVPGSQEPIISILSGDLFQKPLRKLPRGLLRLEGCPKDPQLLCAKPSVYTAFQHAMTMVMRLASDGPNIWSEKTILYPKSRVRGSKKRAWERVWGGRSCHSPFISPVLVFFKLKSLMC